MMEDNGKAKVKGGKKNIFLYFFERIKNNKIIRETLETFQLQWWVSEESGSETQTLKYK